MSNGMDMMKMWRYYQARALGHNREEAISIAQMTQLEGSRIPLEFKNGKEVAEWLNTKVPKGMVASTYRIGFHNDYGSMDMYHQAIIEEYGIHFDEHVVIGDTHASVGFSYKKPEKEEQELHKMYKDQYKDQYKAILDKYPTELWNAYPFVIVTPTAGYNEYIVVAHSHKPQYAAEVVSFVVPKNSYAPLKLGTIRLENDKNGMPIPLEWRDSLICMKGTST